MIRLTRPAVPAGFPTAAIRDASEAADAAVRAGNPPAFPEHWGAYTTVFEVAQHHKCGFCECRFQGGLPTLEHFAPKAKVERLVEPGRELDDAQNIRGRKCEDVWPRGYWWLAYAWNNWLATCNRCNTAWKLCLFPVAETPHPEPSADLAFTPLLLSPFEGPDPEAHLTFDATGQVAAGSPHGRATVETCGLDRESLRKCRKQIADDILRLFEYEATGKLSTQALFVELRARGRAEQDYAAVVRSLVRHRLDMDWADFVGALGG